MFLPLSVCLFVCLFVCLSVCLSAGLLKKLFTDFGEILWMDKRGPSTNRLDFGGDLNHNPDPVIFKGFFYLVLRKSSAEV